jgi:hypothetical protein
MPVHLGKRRCPRCKQWFDKPGNTTFCSRRCHALTPRGKLCPKLSKTDAAYLAGFIDGEGSIIALKRPDGSIKSYRLHAANTHLPTVRWCKRVTKLGRIDVYDRPGCLPIGTWKVHGVKAASILVQVLPFMRIKKVKARRAIKAMQP